jgi:hypothetical protein
VNCTSLPPGTLLGRSDRIDHKPNLRFGPFMYFDDPTKKFLDVMMIVDEILLVIGPVNDRAFGPTEWRTYVLTSTGMIGMVDVNDFMIIQQV